LAAKELKDIEDEVLQMDKELAKLQEMTTEAATHEQQLSSTSLGAHQVAASPMTASASCRPAGSGGSSQGDVSAEGDDFDPESEMNRRSIYVGNVDYGSTPQELQEHFKNCGKILRVTILVDKYYGQPLGYAYIEFSDSTAIANALMLTDSIFRGRQLKVSQKRKNVPGLNKGRGGTTTTQRGAAATRGRGRGNPMFGMYGMMSPYGIPGYGGRGMYMPASMYGYGPRTRGRYARATGGRGTPGSAGSMGAPY